MSKIKKRNSGTTPKLVVEDGDMVVAKVSTDGGAGTVQVVKADRVKAVADAFRRSLGKRDNEGRQIDLDQASNEEVILDVVATVEGIRRDDKQALAEAMWRFWEDPLDFAQRAMRAMAN